MSLRRVRSVVAVLGSALLMAATTISLSAPANAALLSSTASGPRTTWAPAATATIHPGVMMYTAGAQCTANFVFTDSNGNTYVGYAAHCAGLGTSTDTNGCLAGSAPLGTPVDFVQGGSLISAGTTVGHGKLAYSSWNTMINQGLSSATDECAYNDLALVKVTSGLNSVNPSVPFYGGPTGVASGTPATGSYVYSYGNSSLRAGISELSPKVGLLLSTITSGWSHTVYTATPGIPGDSGSGFMDENGNAMGVLSTVAIAPLAGSNGIGDLAKELHYAQLYSGIPGLQLVPGTEPFSPLL